MRCGQGDVLAVDEVVQGGQRAGGGGLQQPGGGPLDRSAVGVLEHDPQVVAGAANAGGGLAQLDEQHSGIRAGGAGVLDALPEQLAQDGDRVNRTVLLEQGAGGRGDVPVLRDAQVLLDSAPSSAEQRRAACSLVVRSRQPRTAAAASDFPSFDQFGSEQVDAGVWSSTSLKTSRGCAGDAAASQYMWVQ
jgi:hypothetical protein